tara:strand:- start:13087 stop:13290 length:204 start_codon:yes stop_codon:yes gene_type:complete
MNLKTNTLDIKLTFQLKIDTEDIEINPKHVVNIIADEIRIRKNYDGFSVDGFEMDYEVRENPKMEKV